MQLTDCHPVVVDAFKREAIYAVLKSIGIPEADRPRWVVARRVVEPVLVAYGEEAARNMLEDYHLPADVLDLEIPEIENLHKVSIFDAPFIACTILGQPYSYPVPDDFEDWGRAA